MENLKKNRGVLNSKFTRKCKLLEKQLTENDPYEVLQNMYEEISSIFKKIEQTNDTILEQINKESSPDIDAITEAEEYMDAVEEKKTKLYVSVVKRKAKGGVSSTSVKVKSLPQPTFNGDIRKLRTFTKDYNHLVIPING